MKTRQFHEPSLFTPSTTKMNTLSCSLVIEEEFENLLEKHTIEVVTDCEKYRALPNGAKHGRYYRENDKETVDCNYYMDSLHGDYTRISSVEGVTTEFYEHFEFGNRVGRVITVRTEQGKEKIWIESYDNGMPSCEVLELEEDLCALYRFGKEVIRLIYPTPDTKNLEELEKFYDFFVSLF